MWEADIAPQEIAWLHISTSNTLLLLICRLDSTRMGGMVLSKNAIHGLGDLLLPMTLASATVHGTGQHYSPLCSTHMAGFPCCCDRRVPNDRSAATSCVSYGCCGRDSSRTTEWAQEVGHSAVREQHILADCSRSCAQSGRVRWALHDTDSSHRLAPLVGHPNCRASTFSFVLHQHRPGYRAPCARDPRWEALEFRLQALVEGCPRLEWQARAT